MTLWRVSNHLTLDGGGGLRASNRWHSRGRRIVYCAPNPATALLEVLVHAEIDTQDMPLKYQFLQIEVPDPVVSETVPTPLPPDWRSKLPITRSIGDDWLRSARTALLQVPSVIVPETWNILLNPTHPQAALLTIAQVHQHSFDTRLQPAAARR